MNVDEIRKYCLAFPEATEKLQWGDALCFKVKLKMFAVLGLDQVRFTFKCTQEKFAELIEREDIRPAPYLGKHNWVMLDRLDALDRKETQDLIRQSYEMVTTKASTRKPPKKTRRSVGKLATVRKAKAHSRPKLRNRPGK